MDKRAAAGAQQLEGGLKAVAKAQRVDGDRLLGARDRPPGPVDGGVGDRLDAAVALGAHDDPAVAQPDPGAQQREAVVQRVAQQLGVAGRGAQQSGDVGGAGRAAGVDHERDMGAVAGQLGGEGDRERAGSGEQDPLPREHALGLDQRLGAAGGQHAGKGPAREGDGTVVGAGGQQPPARRQLAGGPAVGGDDHALALDRQHAGREQDLGAAALRGVDQGLAADVVGAHRGRVADGEARPHPLVDLAAQGDALVDERGTQTGGGRLRGRRQPGGSSACDQQVVVGGRRHFNLLRGAGGHRRHRLGAEVLLVQLGQGAVLLLLAQERVQVADEAAVALRRGP